jgi:hypothetical protein
MISFVRFGEEESNQQQFYVMAFFWGADGISLQMLNCPKSWDPIDDLI